MLRWAVGATHSGNGSVCLVRTEAEGADLRGVQDLADIVFWDNKPVEDTSLIRTLSSPNSVRIKDTRL